MPFTVIVLKKVPNSLRGDLTRWMQEIATGIYVGNYNSRVREHLWKKVKETVGNGEAVMCYSCRNEIGYSFDTCNTERQVVDYDGIPLIMIPAKDSTEKNHREKPYGFSNASKFHTVRSMIRAQKVSVSDKEICNCISLSREGTGNKVESDKVFLDIETTGLNSDADQITEIGAIKVSGGKKFVFHKLICLEGHVPDAVSELTGITDDMLRAGAELENSIRELNKFIHGAMLVGYNIAFDIRFLNAALEKYSMELVHNKTLDLMVEAKRKNCFQDNYKYETTLREYGIDQIVSHRALKDAELMYQLYINMGLK